MLILRLTFSVPAKILIFQIKMNWIIQLDTWVLQSAEILSSRLKEWNLLVPSRNIFKSRKRHVTFANFYAMSSNSDHPSLLLLY